MGLSSNSPPQDAGQLRLNSSGTLNFSDFFQIFALHKMIVWRKNVPVYNRTELNYLTKIPAN